MEERIATVVKNAGSHYLLSELPEWKPFPAVLRGKVRLQKSSATNPIAVGDSVRYLPTAAGTPPEGVRPSGSPHHSFGAVPPLPDRGCHVPQGQHLSGSSIEVVAIGGDTPSRWFTIPGFEAAPASFGSDAPHLTNFEHRAICGPGSIRFAHRPDEQISIAELSAAAERYVAMFKALQ